MDETIKVLTYLCSLCIIIVELKRRKTVTGWEYFIYHVKTIFKNERSEKTNLQHLEVSLTQTVFIAYDTVVGELIG